MKILENLKQKVQSIPEFSDEHYPIAGYVAAGLITVTGLWLVYEVIANDALSFSANWNMFGNAFGNLCFWIGFICAIVFWGRWVHWSSTPVIVKRDPYTGKVLDVKEDYDITEQGFAKILMPIIGHFIVEPIIYGALIYYPVQCVIALVGTIFPYIMSLVILAIVAGSWAYTRVATFRYHSAVLVALCVLLTVAFGYGAYSIHDSYAPHPIELAPGEGPSDIEQTNEQSTVTDDVQTAGESVADNTEDMIENGEDMGEMGEGLFGSLPEGTSVYTGVMEGFTIEMTFVKQESNINGTFKDVMNGYSMHLDGESTPAMGGDIVFYGNMDGSNWTFNLTGNASEITGQADNGATKFNLSLNKK